MPNVGKSTLYNALAVAAGGGGGELPVLHHRAPMSARVSVPDARLSRLAQIAGSAVIIPTQLEFVDIAGLVRGASKGEGLGNQFLAHIRETDAILYVLRCFEDGDIVHVRRLGRSAARCGDHRARAHPRPTSKAWRNASTPSRKKPSPATRKRRRYWRRPSRS
ncbi:MAG: GTPase [Alphaproteobacteria bacterium]